jgi:cytochrome c-type biogenesis protein CcmH
LILPFLLALLAFGALLPIVAPLLRGNRPVAPRGSFDQAVYRDQLRELDRDIARGLITPADAATARLEIQRRLLATEKLPSGPSRLSRSPALAFTLIALTAFGSVGAYLWLGAPGVPDEPFSERKNDTATDNQAKALENATAALAEKVKQNPSDGPSWVLYARGLAMLRQFDKAEDAYRHALALGQDRPDVQADRAEVLVLQAGGTVTPAAEAALKQVLAAEPSNGLARYYLAIAALQAGEPKQAIDGFQALLAEQPADWPVRPQIALRIADAARAAGIPTPELSKGKPPEPEAAKPADADQQAMIRGMVAQLAAKQQADPTNLDGWLRLGRAYSVLGESEKSADAYDQAARLKPNDPSIPLQEIRALLNGQPPTAKLPERVVALLRRVEMADPDQPLALWYLGLAAVQGGHPDDARRYWERLLTQIPAGSDDAKMIQSAVDALAKR